jgi:hypothetical protein
MRIDLRLGFPERGVLVRATAVNTEESDKDVTASFRIDYIYFGPQDLLKSIFAVVSPKTFPSFGHQRPVFPPPMKGETGIWLLERHKDGRLMTKPSRLYRLPLPARDPSHPSFKSAVAFAETVERFSLTDRDNRIEMARSLALDSAPELATYAISLLANSGLPDDQAADYLHEIVANPKLSVSGQIAADEALAKVQRQKWNASAERVKLLGNWVTGKLAKDEFSLVLSRLHSIGGVPSEGGVSQDDFLSLLKDALANENMAFQWRWQFVSLARFAPDRYPDATPTFDWLVGLLRDSDQPRVRIAAAHAIHGTYPLVDEKRRAAIGELVEKETEAEVKKLLERALAHPVPADRVEMPPQQPLPVGPRGPSKLPRR